MSRWVDEEMVGTDRWFHLSGKLLTSLGRFGRRTREGWERLTRLYLTVGTCEEQRQVRTLASLALALVLTVIGILGILVVTRPSSIDDIEFLLFVTIVDALIVVFMHYQHAVEQEWQNVIERICKRLHDTENRLEQRVIERTHQLEQACADAAVANEAISQFLATISHEIRTPLNAIINFNQFVSSGLHGPVNERQHDALEKSTSSARHLLALINDVLDMSKIEAGHTELVLEEGIDLGEEIRDIMPTIQPMLDGKPVDLLLDIADDLPAMSIDRRRMRQVILNLLSNAAKFTDSGYIKVRAWQADDQLLLAVEDTGPGILPEHQSVIFEPFHQLERAYESRAGTGLGLPIARRLVEAHHGKLWLESQVGKGSTFFVALPTAIKAPESRHENAE